MKLQTRYTLTMEEFDEETGETHALVERHLNDPTLDDLTKGFLYFLWNCTFGYVEDIKVEYDHMNSEYDRDSD